MTYKYAVHKNTNWTTVVTPCEILVNIVALGLASCTAKYDPFLFIILLAVRWCLEWTDIHIIMIWQLNVSQFQYFQDDQSLRLVCGK